MKTEVGVRGFFYFFLLFSPVKRHQTSTMQVEDGEDGASAGRGEGGADAHAAGARPSEHAAAPARPATADAFILRPVFSLPKPAQVTSVVLFNIGPVTPNRINGLFDSVRKPRCIRQGPNRPEFPKCFEDRPEIDSFRTKDVD